MNTRNLLTSICIILLCVAMPSNLYAGKGMTIEQLDSLLKIYEKTGNLSAANCLYENIYGDYEDTLTVFTKGDAKEYIDANLYSTYGSYLYDHSFYAKSIRFSKLGVTSAEKIKDMEVLASCYSYLCCAYQYIGDLDKAVTYAKRLYDIDSASGDKANMSSTLNNIASIYLLDNKPEKAEKYILRAINIERQLNKPAKLAIRLGKASDVYQAMKKYDLGLKYAKEAFRLDSITGNADKMAVRLCQIADNYWGMQDSVKAMKLYNVAAGVFRQTQNYNSLSVCLQHTGQYEEALKLTEITGNIKIRKSILSLLALKEKDPQKAKKYMAEAMALHDSITSNENELMTERFNVEYESLQKDAELEHQQNLIEMQQQRQQYILIILSMFCVLSFVAVMGWIRDYHSRKKVEEANRVKDRLISVISHDLSGTAANINMLSKLVADLNPSQQTTMLAKQSDSLKSLLDNLLLWSRLQRSGMVQVNLANLSLADVINEAIDSHRETANEKNVSIILEGDDTTTINADRNCVKCMVRNLVSNAIKFTPEEGTITIRYDKDHIEVRDSGTGMDAETLQNLRDGKKWTHKNGTKGEPGSGLGMSIVRDMIRLCGYKLTIDSKEGEGSSFKIAFV